MLRFVAGILLAPALFAAGRDLVVVDTDSGLFGDDGAAVAMALRSPARVSVQGILLTPGNVWPAQGAEYTFHILDLLGRRNVPLYTGAQSPLLHSAALSREAGRLWGPPAYAGAFAEDPAQVVPAPGAALTGRKPRPGAVEFLISEIERRPGEITVLELAPMTSLALALRLQPDIETKIKRVVFMGGAIGVPGNASPSAEFNFWFDPEAARIVLRSRIPEKMMFGLDICNTAPIHKAEFDRIAMGVTAIAIRSNSALWMGAVLQMSSPNIIFSGMRDRNTIRAASGSNQKLNSADGDALPGTPMAPPMKTTRLILVSISGCSRKASARLVIGASSRTVISPGRRSISEIKNSTAPGRGLRPVSAAPGAGTTWAGSSANAPA